MEKVDVKAALKAAAKAAEQIKVAAVTLRTERAERERERAVLLAQNELLYRQPVARAEIKAAVLHAIDQWGDEFGRRWTLTLSDFLAPKGMRPRLDGPVSLDASTFQPSDAPMTLQDLDAIIGGEHTAVLSPLMKESDRYPGAINPYRNLFSGVLDETYALDNPANHQLALRGAFFFFGDAIKAKVEKHFDSVARPNEDATSCAAKPESEQRALLESAASRITTMRDEISGIEAELTKLRRIETLDIEIANWERELPTGHQQRRAVVEPLKKELSKLDPQEAWSSATERRLRISACTLNVKKLKEKIAALSAADALPVDLRRAIISANLKRLNALQEEIDTIDSQLAQMREGTA